MIVSVCGKWSLQKCMRHFSFRMDLTEILLVFSMMWKMSSGIHCYKCHSSMDSGHPLCESFDYSAQYVKDCDNSTLCYKKTITTQFGTKIYERDCAHQTMDGYQEIINGQWHEMVKIIERDEGCEEDASDKDKVTKTEHCHCRGHLCNGAGDPSYEMQVRISSVRISISVLASTVVLLVLR